MPTSPGFMSLAAKRLQKRKRRALIAVRVLATLMYGAAIAVFLMWHFPSPSMTQPSRSHAVTISLVPADAEAYRDAIAGYLAVEVNGAQLSWKNYLGVRPPSVVTIRRSIYTEDRGREFGWYFTATRDFEYKSPECIYSEDRRKAQCTWEWRQGLAGTPVLIEPGPYQLAAKDEPGNEYPVLIKLDFLVQFPTLAVSAEDLSGVPVDFAELTWAPADESAFLYPPQPGPGEKDEFFTNGSRASMPALRARSLRTAYVELAVCPSCMPLEAYDCADEVTKATYQCWAPSNTAQTISWSARRVDLAWQRDVSGWGLASLVGAGISAAGILAFRQGRRRSHDEDSPSEVVEARPESRLVGLGGSRAAATKTVSPLLKRSSPRRNRGARK